MWVRARVTAKRIGTRVRRVNRVTQDHARTLILTLNLIVTPNPKAITLSLTLNPTPTPLWCDHVSLYVLQWPGPSNVKLRRPVGVQSWPLPLPHRVNTLNTEQSNYHVVWIVCVLGSTTRHERGGVKNTVKLTTNEALLNETKTNLTAATCHRRILNPAKTDHSVQFLHKTQYSS